nr:RNA-directed DNA polymerase, eukaryota [Tanacetum cinerariifolium]
DISVEGNFDAKPEAQEANNVFNKSDVEEVLETEFDVPSGKKDNQSEDPFGLYPLLQKENINMACKVNEEVHSLSHPPGFTPEGDLFEGKSMGGNAEKVYEEKEKGEKSFVNNDIGKDTSNSVNKNVESTCSGRSKKSDMPRSGGSILNLMKEVVKVGQTMGYNMEGCIKDIIGIIESHGEFGETKMGFMDLNTVRSCWGNSIFEYAQSDSVDSVLTLMFMMRKSLTLSIFNAGIEEVPLGGSAFTWCHKSASKMSKLDRFFVFENLLISCPNISVITLERFISDHRPILLRESMFDYGPIPFRFYRYWLEVDGFDKMVRDSWEAAPGNKDNGIRNFMGKLKFLKERIRIWLSMHKANSRCETSILKVELRVCDETIDKEELEQMITKEEVKRAVWDCGVDKSPGPDGLSFGFYRHFWPMIEEDVFGAVEYFFIHGDMPKGCNSNFIALIPKVLDANMKKKHALIFKVDFEKAYDLVRWDFLDDVLDKFGFGAKWRTWIHSCLRSSRGSILINGSPTASGLRINMCKSKIMGVNVEDAKVKTAATKLGCLVLKTPFTYLGTKVGDNMSRKHAWNEVEEKVISRLSRWKMKTLSIGVVSLTVQSRRVKKRLRGLMFKWLWRFYSQKHSLWTKVIKAIYGEDGSFDKVGVSGGRTCWKSIVQEVKVLQGRGVNVHDFIKLKLGNEDCSRFWIDKWYEGEVLKRLFPRVYALELNKNVSVSSKLNAPRLDTSFRRIARSGIEETQFNSMVEIVKATSLMPCDDRYTWSLENDGTFSVIDGNRFQEVSLSTRWVKSVPIKVNILAWKVKSNALPTCFNISRRGIDIDSIDCPICKMGVETTSHVFFQCNVVRQIMRKISSWWSVDYMEVNSYEDWRAWLVSTRIRSSLKGIIEGIYYGLWWVMWNFRNKLLFDTKTPEKALIFNNLVSSSFYWFKYRCKASFKWDDWLKNPYIVCF